MGIIELLLLAAGLSMDAFAVSICKGIETKKAGFKQLMLCGIWFGCFQGLMPFIGYLLVILAVYVLTYPTFRDHEVMAAFTSLFYVSVMLSYVYLLRERAHGGYLVILIFVCSWGSDTLAYCTGRLFGKHKMSPKLSPKKSVEGLFGGLIGAGIYKTILIVASDNNSKITNWEDRGTSILFGDGAGAMVVTESDDGIDDILSIDISADGSIGQMIQTNMPGQCCPLVEQADEVGTGKIIMNGKEVYKFAVSTVPSYVEKCIEASGMTSEEIDYLIPHQANQRIIESIQNRLKYTDDKVISNIKYYGNTSAASIPIALVEGVEQGKIKLGSTAVLCGFGAGMTWGAAVVRLRKGIC